MVTARFLVAPSLWDSVIFVTVGNVGGLPVGSAAPLGGYGTGYGGGGYYNTATHYGTGGGGGSSVSVGVSVVLLFSFLSFPSFLVSVSSDVTLRVSFPQL